MRKELQKIGFWPVLAIVIGSQIGSGVFMLPTTMAPFGMYSLVGWLLAGVSAILLAIVFSILCFWFPKTGGPHVYIKEAFGNTAAFFVGWTYWVVSWVSSITVIIATIGYLMPFLGQQSSNFYLVLELLLLWMLTLLNLKGVCVAGRAEFILSLVKFVPLFILPICAIANFDINNIQLDASFAGSSTTNILGKATVLALWGFIGVESATTPAGSVVNPKKTIPLAIIVGTFIVAIVYMLNVIGIMGLIPGSELAESNAPYVDATRLLFGGNWYYLISAIAAVICIGTLNAWILTSGQIALGNAEDGLFPKIFGIKNKHNAPYFSILISAIGLCPLLVITSSLDFAEQLTKTIDISVLCFLYVYIACCIAFTAIALRKKLMSKYKYGSALLGIFAAFFCLWVISEYDMSAILLSLLFPITGIPIFIYKRVQSV